MADSATANKKETTQSKKRRFRLHPVLKKMLRQLLIFLISLALVAGTIAFAIQTVYDKFIKPVDPEDDTLVTVEVPMGTSINGIAMPFQSHSWEHHRIFAGIQ
jgi:cell division protein YceG involved in septum cleavage